MNLELATFMSGYAWPSANGESHSGRPSGSIPIRPLTAFRILGLQLRLPVVDKGRLTAILAKREFVAGGGILQRREDRVELLFSYMDTSRLNADSVTVCQRSLPRR